MSAFVAADARAVPVVGVTFAVPAVVLAVNVNFAISWSPVRLVPSAAPLVIVTVPATVSTAASAAIENAEPTKLIPFGFSVVTSATVGT